MDFEALKTYIIELFQNDLSDTLSYHAVDHTFDVLNTVEKLAVSEELTGEETLLLKTAALLHDSGFLVQYNSNEPLGCSLAEKILPKFGYSNEKIRLICSMIMATEIPQNPKNKLEQIICDADLDYLGRPDFFSISEKLREELTIYGKEFTDKEWLEFEITFIEKHKYFTKTANKLRTPVKEKHLKHLKKQLSALKSAKE
jgi:HD superfamily phosphodiesterase